MRLILCSACKHTTLIIWSLHAMNTNQHCNSILHSYASVASSTTHVAIDCVHLCHCPGDEAIYNFSSVQNKPQGLCLRKPLDYQVQKHQSRHVSCQAHTETGLRNGASHKWLPNGVHARTVGQYMTTPITWLSPGMQYTHNRQSQHSNINVVGESISPWVQAAFYIRPFD